MKPILFIFSILMFVCCSEDNGVEPNIEFREVQFDLQNGFEDKSVSIIVDSTNHFSATLSSSVPLAGPQAYFNVLLEKGDHRLIIFGSELGNIYKVYTDNTIISIGESRKYFIGIGLYEDSIKVVVQDSSFFYI